ncbi:sulfatase [Sinomicrobium weinanense]|uniref:Sulfatase n=1 Tax=Sinomicrobium weinanense TaxID=2842200 RepID=A0A926JVZ5_9FLAO|nr:sulfatase [Sinomicrobium weinanense]MBC9798391.1 sulfatase [Sinomicrobium weinanense]MBU3124818.1 sulfatase [Sinomicrobium weinanense]
MEYTIRKTIILITGLCLFACKNEKEDKSGDKPNVLFIAIDDMNDDINLLGTTYHIQTPGLEKIAQQGVLFTNAFCNTPACNPSRSSILSGLYPATTGIYGNQTDWRAAIPDAITLPEYFKQNGYLTIGAGKIYHHQMNHAFHDDGAFDEFLKLPRYPDDPPPEKLNGLPVWIGGDRDGTSTSIPFDWGARSYGKNHQHPDIRTVDWLIKKLDSIDEPFFMGAGIFRPHMPNYAPQEYFDMYPADSLVMPALRKDDLKDLPQGALTMLDEGKPFIYNTIRKGSPDGKDKYKEALQAYYASCTFADAQIGRLFEALQKSKHAKNTIVIVWSDHGYHLGEKEHWEKFVLWDKANHIPMIISGPGVPKGTRVDTPVSLIDIYPTLTELSGLPQKAGLEGNSLAGLMNGKDTIYPPVRMTYGYKNHAVRGRKWKYISYNDGTEELYNIEEDPNEWKNLAGDPTYDNIKDSLRDYLPSFNRSPMPDIVVSSGEPGTY